MTFFLAVKCGLPVARWAWLISYQVGVVTLLSSGCDLVMQLGAIDTVCGSEGGLWWRKLRLLQMAG